MQYRTTPPVGERHSYLEDMNRRLAAILDILGSCGDFYANIKTDKTWLAEGAWNLNRWEKRGDTPGITKDQIDKVKANY